MRRKNGWLIACVFLASCFVKAAVAFSFGQIQIFDFFPRKFIACSNPVNKNKKRLIQERDDVTNLGAGWTALALVLAFIINWRFGLKLL